MTDGEETVLEMAERHVAESEARIARLKAIIEELERDNHPNAAEQGCRVLAVMEETLRLFRRQVEFLRPPTA